MSFDIVWLLDKIFVVNCDAYWRTCKNLKPSLQIICRKIINNILQGRQKFKILSKDLNVIRLIEDSDVGDIAMLIA